MTHALPFPYQAPLILAAIPEEELALIEALGGHPQFKRLEVDPRLGLELLEHLKSKLLVARSGIGPVNAALSVALLTRARPEIDSLILLGVGGALIPELSIGQLVVSSCVLQHDSFSSLDFGHPRMLAGKYILTPEDAQGHLATLRADARLEQWVLAQAPGSHSGAVLSGNEFVGTVERKRAIAALHSHAALVDMEAAGVAQIAHRLGLPFVIAKTVADRLQPDGTIESDFRACLHAAARNAAQVARKLRGHVSP